MAANYYRQNNMNKTIITILVVAVLFLLGFYLLSDNSEERNSDITENTATHVIEGYGISFAYPESLDVREYQSEFISVGHEDGEAFDSEVDVQIVRSFEGSADNFSDFVHEQARSFCAADGIDRSIECRDVRGEQVFQTKAGVAGITFNLDEVMTELESGEEVVSEKGPFFVINISAFDEESEFAALFVRTPSAKPEGDVDQSLVRQVAESVMIERPAN